MCLAIPGKIVELDPHNAHLAVVDVVGVRRKVDLGLLQDEPPVPGDWVLIHVGFAMSKISEADAADQMQNAAQCWARPRPPCRKCAAMVWRTKSQTNPRSKGEAMKFVDEFRAPELITKAGEEIRRLADPNRHYRIMEVCGGHTHAIYRFGLKDLLPSNVELIHGPGCPVCVLPDGPNRRWFVHRDAAGFHLRGVWRHDARSGNSRKPAGIQSAWHGRSNRLLAGGCA